MARKQKFEGGTKNRIIEVGCKMFLENGFDGTGIRAVMERVGADVGVFYYYFNTKDDLFSDVLERLMEPYKPTFEQMVEDAKADPFAELFRFFNYLQEAAIDFRTKYGENLHRAVHWSICAHALATVEPYVEEIVSMIVENGATPVMDIHTSAIYLTHAIGSCYLSEDTAWLNVAKPQIAKSVEVLMGLDKQ